MLSKGGAGPASVGGQQRRPGPPPRRPRDASAHVFGTWRPAAPLIEGIDVRRLLDVAPHASSLLLPRRLQPVVKQQQSHQQQEERRQQQQQQQQQQRILNQLEQDLRQQQQATAVPAPAPPASAVGQLPLHLSWAGSGIYFWWQLGAMQYLSQRFDLTRVPMAGASGGALCAALARCGVDAEAAAASAYELAVRHRIWDKPLGLAGSWGGLIEQWLHDLLPADAAERCSGQLAVVVTEVPAWRQLAISDFADKADLVNVCMASAHVPLLLDRSLSRACPRRGALYVDGSFPDFFSGQNCDHLTRGGDAVVFDYFDDPRLERGGRMDMLTLKRCSAIRKILILGARYAARLDAEGAFDRFDVESVRRSGLKCR